MDADRPLLVLLLPAHLERFAERGHADTLLRAADAVAVEPPPIAFETLARLPALLSDVLASAQARRLRLPGDPRAVVLYHPLQYPLARGLLVKHAGCELWYGGAPVPGARGRVGRRARELHELAVARASLTFATADGTGALHERLAAVGLAHHPRG